MCRRRRGPDSCFSFGGEHLPPGDGSDLLSAGSATDGRPCWGELVGSAGVSFGAVAIRDTRRALVRGCRVSACPDQAGVGASAMRWRLLAEAPPLQRPPDLDHRFGFAEPASSPGGAGGEPLGGLCRLRDGSVRAWRMHPRPGF